MGTARINTLIKLSVIFFLFSIVTGCVQKETPKKVSLLKREGPFAKTENAVNETLQFGFDLRLDPKDDVRVYTPFLKYLEKTTGKRLGIKFTEKYDDTLENLGRGVTHFAAIGSLSYVIGREKYGYAIKYLVSGVNKDGTAKHRSVIFIKPESNIQDIRNLRGKSFAFGPKMSTQGHLIPRKMLEDAGISLDDLSNYTYTGSHINTVRSVLNGEYDAGSIQDTLAKRLAEEGNIRILKISEPYPNSIIAYNSTVDSETVETIKSALLAFEPTGKHTDMLIDWDKTEMPLGFTTVNEYEFYSIAVLARKYGLITQ